MGRTCCPSGAQRLSAGLRAISGLPAVLPLQSGPSKAGLWNWKMMVPICHQWSSLRVDSTDPEVLGSNPTFTVSSLCGPRLVTFSSLNLSFHICKMGIVKTVPAKL